LKKTITLEEREIEVLIDRKKYYYAERRDKGGGTITAIWGQRCT